MAYASIMAFCRDFYYQDLGYRARIGEQEAGVSFGAWRRAVVAAVIGKPTKNPSRWVPLETQDEPAALARLSAPTAAVVVCDTKTKKQSARYRAPLSTAWCNRAKKETTACNLHMPSTKILG